MKIEKFTIAFDNPVAAYHAGEIITGKIILTIAETELKSNGIFLRCIGKAHVHWRENRTDYRGIEHYFDFKIPVPGNLTSIPVGQYTFPFGIALPRNLPTSFEGRYGHIRYICKCNISRSMRIDPKTKAPFSVLSTADLNRIPTACNPLIVTRTKSIGVLVFKTGTITCNINVCKSAFVPGEYIYINAKISNKTSKEIARTTVYLYSRTKYFVRKYSKTTTQHLRKVTRAGIPPNSDGEWVNVPLRIPSVPPSGLGGCRIIQTNYYLKFTVVPKGILAFDMDMELPLTIGTIPLMRDFLLIEPSPLQYQPLREAEPYTEKQNQSSPPEYPSQSEEMQAYPSMPPPTYEETVYGRSVITEEDDDNSQTNGRVEFAPRYAYYQYSNNAENQPAPP